MSTRAFLFGLGLIALASAASLADGPKPSAEKTPADLQKEVERLNKLVKEMGEQLEGTAKPINLGRTSLCQVNASSVNGGRDLGNVFYGVQNAFDDGKNVVNGLNYTYWLSDAGSSWIELKFDSPLTVTQVVVEQGPEFFTRFGMAKGGEEVYPKKSEQLELPKPMPGVTSVKISFVGDGNVKVHEIRVMGHVPPNVKCEEGTPRIMASEEQAAAIAKGAFDVWQASLTTQVHRRIETQDDAFIVTFFREKGFDLFRVRIPRKGTGKITTEVLVDFVPKPKK